MRAGIMLVVLLCMGAIIYGNFHWNNKLGSAMNQELVTTNTNQLSTQVEVLEKKEELPKGDFANLPPEVSDFLVGKNNKGEVVELVIIGSEVNELNENNWSNLFKEELEATYNGLFNITVNAIPGEVTTTDVVNEGLHLENINTVPDLVILEPFLLESNGLIAIEHSLQNVTIMIEDLKQKNPNLFLFLQPGQPLKNAIYYPMDIEELKTWAEEHGYPYINHWESWPKEPNEISEYIVTEDIIPNEKGHEVWAEHIINYFIGKN
ncbi:SGNH/GDSL hydrolase family protein [Sutcliffiella horikoshii]|uniref:SGNH/GDSL hydrolase family protein n=1 Tax=Sutcliffiella horikoshii TaxID=79883 RepID=UPI00384AA626